MLLSSLFKQPNEGRFTIATSGRNHWRYKRIAHSISWVILHTAVISCTFKMNFSEGYPQSELTINSKNQVITSFQQKFIHMTFVPAASFFPSHSALMFNTSLKKIWISSQPNRLGSVRLTLSRTLPHTHPLSANMAHCCSAQNSTC